jgi:hypothetical protein
LEALSLDGAVLIYLATMFTATVAVVVVAFLMVGHQF